MSNNGENQEQLHPCRIKFCRGTAGACPHSLLNGQPEIEAIEGVVTEAIAVASRQMPGERRESHHPGLRVAMAACPNACTEPQTKDVGIITIKAPTGVGSSCDGCGRCEMVCREDAIRLTNGRAQIVPEKCLGCGQCISECPREAINSRGLQFRILVGGRMGRHPRWAEELCLADDSDLVNVLQSFFDRISRHARPGERTANTVERVGAVNLREEMFVDL